MCLKYFREIYSDLNQMQPLTETESVIWATI